MSSGFIDYVRIFVKGGDGGSGCASFRREKGVPHGGPDGGNGGRGGAVYLEGDSGLLTLLDFKYNPQIKASRGGHGRGKGCYGKNGRDSIAKVPLGTVIRDAVTCKEFGEILYAGQKLLVADGGRGGRGNKSFATSINRAPRERELGGQGEERTLELELKLIADAGLVGAPNAGKSTLINFISTAKSKTAPYPFTTLTPVLGVVDLEEEGRIVVADMPGLIKGASRGKGLGDKFLRHIERTTVLAILVDMADKPIDDFFMLMEELGNYSPLLSEKKYIVAANKMDLNTARKNYPVFLSKAGVKKNKVFPISAIKGEGIDELLKGVLYELQASD